MKINNFIRERVLTFPVLVLFLMNLAKKSLQVSLNSFLETIDLTSITKQAFSKARKKLSPKTFILLNRKLLEEYYTDNQFSTWEGFRLIAIDGSDLQLPQKEALKSKFGCAKNDKGSTLVMAKLSCAYDVLNCKTLDAQIDRCKSSERDLAVAHIEAIQQLHHDETKDLYIFDRGYPSLGLLFYLKDQKKDYIMRTSFTSCFIAIKKRLEEGCTDFTLRLYANEVTHQQAQELKKRVPLLDRQTSYVEVRVVVVILENGEKELLISSLIDKRYSATMLKKLYGLRWGKEENYKWYKVGMELEDFSGHSELAIEQEVWALIFTANVASLIIQEAQEEIDQEHNLKQLKHHYKINKRVAIGSLKDKLITVLFDKDGDISSFCDSLKEEFKRNLCPIREGRKFKRIKKSRRKYGCTLRRCI
jgi:hypothetical protein